MENVSATKEGKGIPNMKRRRRVGQGVLWGMGLSLLVVSCTTHKVEVEGPDKPITINLNVKIDHEVRVKVEKDLKDVFSEDSGLF